MGQKVEINPDSFDVIDGHVFAELAEHTSVESKIGEAIKKLRESKECEHVGLSRFPIDKSKIVNCSVCDPLNVKEDPFWLKVGDVIRPKESNHFCYRILEKTKKGFIDAFKVKIISNDQNNDAELTLPITYIPEEQYKKIKLVSPAIIKHCGYYFPSDLCFSEKPEEITQTFPSSTFGLITFKNFYWPAKDQFGRAIWYEVEE